LKVYLIGSLRNPGIPETAFAMRTLGLEVFDDWYAAGPHADDCWKAYEQGKGLSYTEALRGHAARHVFSFDKRHLDESDAAVLALPAGRSGHLELGYMKGQGKPVAVLLDDPERWDVMYQFADAVCDSTDALLDWLRVRYTQ
jgi:hypothetical protein